MYVCIIYIFIYVYVYILFTKRIETFWPSDILNYSKC